MINIDTYKATLDATTQLVISSSNNPSISLRLKTNDHIMRYNHVTAEVFVDTFFAENMINRKLQFTCFKFFVIDFGYTHIFLMNYKGDLYHVMNNFFKNVGVPPAIIYHFTGGKVQGEARGICDQVGC